MNTVEIEQNINKIDVQPHNNLVQIDTINIQPKYYFLQSSFSAEVYEEVDDG